MDNSTRERAIAIIRDCANRQRGDLLKAVFDLRHNALPGDERLVYPLLDHPDDGIVASALYSLVEVHGQLSHLVKRVYDFAWGDPRDSGEMPIQSEAIRILAECAKADLAVAAELCRIAEDENVSDVPRKDAWQFLAGLFGVEWLPSYSTEMIMNPMSQQSEEIRTRIRQAVPRTLCIRPVNDVGML